MKGRARTDAVGFMGSTRASTAAARRATPPEIFVICRIVSILS